MKESNQESHPLIFGKRIPFLLEIKVFFFLYSVHGIAIVFKVHFIGRDKHNWHDEETDSAGLI